MFALGFTLIGGEQDEDINSSRKTTHIRDTASKATTWLEFDVGII
jgi:hypothetical protein